MSSGLPRSPQGCGIADFRPPIGSGRIGGISDWFRHRQDLIGMRFEPGPIGPTAHSGRARPLRPSTRPVSRLASRRRPSGNRVRDCAQDESWRGALRRPPGRGFSRAAVLPRDEDRRRPPSPVRDCPMSSGFLKTGGGISRGACGRRPRGRDPAPRTTWPPALPCRSGDEVPLRRRACARRLHRAGSQFRSRRGAGRRNNTGTRIFCLPSERPRTRAALFEKASRPCRRVPGSPSDRGLRSFRHCSPRRTRRTQGDICNASSRIETQSGPRTTSSSTNIAHGDVPTFLPSFLARAMVCHR